MLRLRIIINRFLFRAWAKNAEKKMQPATLESVILETECRSSKLRKLEIEKRGRKKFAAERRLSSAKRLATHLTSVKKFDFSGISSKIEIAVYLGTQKCLKSILGVRTKKNSRKKSRFFFLFFCFLSKN